MIPKVLQNLTTDGFYRLVVGINTFQALYSVLSRTVQVNQMAESYSAGLLPDSAIEDFVKTLYPAFRPGERFPFDHVLAAVACGLRGRQTKFAREYLDELSRVKRNEFSMARGVAQLCQRDIRSSGRLTTVGMFSDLPNLPSASSSSISTVASARKNRMEFYFDLEAE